KDHVVFLLCPVVFSFENVKARGGVFSWEPERGTRLGVMPRNGGNADVRWFDTDPCYVFHSMNAYDVDGTIVLNVARYGRLDFMRPEAARDPQYRRETAAPRRRAPRSPAARTPPACTAGRSTCAAAASARRRWTTRPPSSRASTSVSSAAGTPSAAPHS